MKRKPCKKAMLVYMAIFAFVLVFVGGVYSSIVIAKDNKEIGPNEVQGKVLSIHTRPFGRGVINVKSDQTDEVYTIYVGQNTYYNPDRRPKVGETIKVHYLNDRGTLKATRVEIIETPK